MLRRKAEVSVTVSRGCSENVYRYDLGGNGVIFLNEQVDVPISRSVLGIKI